MVNGHFDGPLASPGAADCASCVASMLESLRYIIETDWVPPAPIIFLFNGAEELFLLGSHGFMTTHRWRSLVGAFVNIEASGASGPDFVVQSGPGAWPAQIYAESAIIPMANCAAQDVFPFIPGDTDYRIFSQDFGDIPGLDILFLLDGYVYHTPYDRPERISHGSLQARGENLLALLKGFTSSCELKNAAERSKISKIDKFGDGKPFFFDFLGLFMVYYSRKVATFLHLFPLFVVILMPFLASERSSGFTTVTSRFQAIIQGGMVHCFGFLLAILLPVIMAVLRLCFSTTAMTWFGRPWVAVGVFLPSAMVGLLIPKALELGDKIPRWNIRKADVIQVAIIWGSHWGAVGVYALESAVVTLLGLNSGFFTFWWALFMMPALSIHQMVSRIVGKHSMLSLLGYLFPAILPAAYSISSGVIMVQFIAEKMGMSGSHPQPFGFILGDVVMAALLGSIAVMCLAPFLPVLGVWIGTPHVIRFLLYFSIGAAALSSHVFPYSTTAPKRLILQHTFRTTGASVLLESSYDFATVDANSWTFVLKNAPDVAESLHPPPKLSRESSASTFMGLYPISLLLSPSFTVPVTSQRKQAAFPQLHLIKIQTMEDSKSIRRKIYMELDLGSLKEVWASVLNITGPLARWSFAEEQLQAPEIINGGPPSFICRLSGRSPNENWKFWVEASSLDPIRIDLAVLDQQLEESTRNLANKFPQWVAVTAGSSFLSSYIV
ncbi:hypothetical protein O6H91_22G010500 [Diphasiastrum complanatum]|uniref:Uncharacterized protein n=3 Tax=Diphasiastrum complanatum TaxID=34168 RepID=A0ACC2ACX8_DIPCM|nr:hypothetical protein O6H91_22G010500 [Diphasiastrum complanatum]